MSAEACDALLPTHACRHPEILKCVSVQQTLWLAQCAGGLAVFSYFPESALTMLLTHSATAQFWQTFSTQDTPATDLFKKSKSPKYPWLTNHPSLPVCVAIQTAYRVL